MTPAIRRSFMAIVFLRWRADCARKFVRQQADRGGHAGHAGHASSRAPLLVINSERGVRIICACCAQASRVGVQIGMDLAHARALCPPPRTEVEAQPEREMAILRALARWCQRYSPITAIEPTDGPTAILVDITGCERVHPSNADLTQRVVRELAERGFTARVAIASTAAAAVAIAQSCASDLASCPISALRISRQAIEALAEVQVEKIGQLIRLPRASVMARYGGDVLHRLDMALGEAIEILTTIRSQPPPSVEHIFDGPVTNHEGIALVVARLFEELCVALRARVRGGREFELTATCADAPMYRQRMMLGAPSARAAHLFKLFAPHLERIPMGMGIESLRIAVLRMGAWSPQSQRSDGCENSVGEWADTVTAQLGDRALFRGGFAEHHQPNRSIRWIAIARCGLSPRVALRHASVRAAFAWRPSTWLTPPESIVVTAAHAPSVCWRGSVVEIATWRGPERISSPWSASASMSSTHSVDYWRLETTQGAWLWVAHSAGGWAMVGVWS